MDPALEDLCKYLDENVILVNLHQPADVIRQLHAENERMREHVRQLEIALRHLQHEPTTA
jgi:Ni,Fe-hydrogenase III large subunit